MARNALGRGLSALIRDPEIAAPVPPPPSLPVQAHEVRTDALRDGLVQVDIDLIDPSPYQPRTKFREEGLDELARSIRTSGIIQPLVVRPRGARFQLIAGERRWRAAQRAAMSRVPVVVRDVNEESALEMTLVENLQREDLNPIEEASAFERLIEEFRLTQEQVAERTGKDRATIANALRLRKLERPIQELIEDRIITAGHGRALLAIQDPRERLALAKRAARGEMTVRQLERLATRPPRRPNSTAPSALDANTKAAIEELQRQFGTRVLIHPRTPGRPGQLVFEYYNDADLARLYDRLIKN